MLCANLLVQGRLHACRARGCVSDRRGLSCCNAIPCDEFFFVAAGCEVFLGWYDGGAFPPPLQAGAGIHDDGQLLMMMMMMTFDEDDDDF